MSLSSIELREAVILSVRLGYGLCELDDVEQWATRLIERIDDPPYALLQLGLARVNGAEICFEAFGSLGPGEASPNDFLLAMSSAEPQSMSHKQQYDLLGAIWQRGLDYVRQDPTDNNPVLSLLIQALDVHDAMDALETVGTTSEITKLAVSNYFRRLRESAARITGPS